MTEITLKVRRQNLSLADTKNDNLDHTLKLYGAGITKGTY